MPRRKKTDQSPARFPDGPPLEWGSIGHHTGFPPQGQSALTGSSNSVTSSQNDVVLSMQEMFPHLDPEVIYIVLSECDFKVENSMDSLLELAVAAEVAPPVQFPVSSFEQTAAALLNPCSFSEAKPDSDSSKPSQKPSSSPYEDILSVELDLLIDQELETFNTLKEEQNSSQSLSDTSMAFPPLPFPQQSLPELLQSSLEPGTQGLSAEESAPVGSLLHHMQASSSPLNDLSTWDNNTEEGQQSLVDFTHLMSESTDDKPKTSFDLAASGRTSAFQVYKKQESLQPQSEQEGHSHADAVGGTRSKVKTFYQEPYGFTPSQWNKGPPIFPPYKHGHPRPSFIIPVARRPPNWPVNPRHVSPWMRANPAGQAPLKHHSAIPKSWAVTPGPQAPFSKNWLYLEGKVLVLLRGPPGSGKTTLARAFLECNPGGVILSTDDYFTRNEGYFFNPAILGEAHNWNHIRARNAFIAGASPIIIDNTNLQAWEMKPYVYQAIQHDYKVLFKEPDTWWKIKPKELARRTTHSVQVEKISRMLERFERFVTVRSIMSSHMPGLETSCQPTYSSNKTCPDLVGRHRLTRRSKKFCGNLSTSLPDVSSIGRSGQENQLEDRTKKSTQSLNSKYCGELFDNADSSERRELELNSLSSKADSHIDLINSVGEKTIPDCIVESLMTEESIQDDAPVAFSESIKQRVSQERLGRRSSFEKVDHKEVIKDINQSDKETEGKKPTDEEETGDLGLEKYVELNFEGDWPCEGPLQQRRLKDRESQKEVCGEEKEINSQNLSDSEEKSVKPLGSPDFKEFQKCLDLIQPVVDHTEASAEPFLLASELELLVVVDGIADKPRNKKQNVEIVHGKTGELPDCVLDWRTVRESTSDCGEAPGTEREVSRPNGRITSMTAEVCKEGVENHCHNSIGSLDGDIDGESQTKDNDSLVSETYLSPEENLGITVTSDDRKQRRSRSGKHCKLALTFTQNSSNSSPMYYDSSETTPQNFESSQNDASSIVTPRLDSDTIPIPKFCLTAECELEADDPNLLVETSRSTQTEPQAFAFLWRLNCKESPDYTVNTSYSHRSGVKVLSSDPSRFMPGALPAEVAVQPSGQGEVPYRVVHEKGTHVEEKDFGGTQDRIESLRILSCHFRLVSFDILEDLYEKCHQDLEWTTNLLLDSGERFYRDENDAAEETSQNLSKHCKASEEIILCSEKEYQQKGSPTKEETQWSTCEAGIEPEDTMFDDDIIRSRGGAAEDTNKQYPNTTYVELYPHTKALTKGPRSNTTECKAMPELNPEALPWGGNFDIEAVIKDSEVEMKYDIASMDEINRVLQAELEEMEREENQRKAARSSQNLDIQSVELKLPTEVALQLTELFGPVGVDPGTCSGEDYVVQMDLNFCKLLHQKWKDSIQERQKQTNLSFHLLQECSAKQGQWGQPHLENFRVSTDGSTPPDSQMPFMDHWNVSHCHVSLRDIIKEEQALHQTIERMRQSCADLNRRDGATLLKENQLYSLFPNIDKHFLRDILRDHNYNLTKTEQFLRSLLSEESVKTVVAPEAPRSEHQRGTSKERKKMQKQAESAVVDYQDTEDPEYEDFRAEAALQRKRQLESFSKAAEAYKQGRREVASFYAQQGHLHGQRMQEANHRAAAQIFERVNLSLLAKNALDLHGLHVDEALHHLDRVLEEKAADCEKGLCQPQLSIITGRGNHSRGGVARIRPAVIDYLIKKHYRFTEPNPGLVLVSLK